MEGFEYLVLFHSDIKDSKEYVKKVIWLIPKFEGDDIKITLDKLKQKQKKFTIDDFPTYLLNPYTISEPNLLKLESSYKSSHKHI